MHFAWISVLFLTFSPAFSRRTHTENNKNIEKPVWLLVFRNGFLHNWIRLQLWKEKSLNEYAVTLLFVSFFSPIYSMYRALCPTHTRFIWKNVDRSSLFFPTVHTEHSAHSHILWFFMYDNKMSTNVWRRVNQPAGEQEKNANGDFLFLHVAYVCCMCSYFMHNTCIYMYFNARYNEQSMWVLFIWPH